MFEPTFDIPTNRQLDAKLLTGSAIFGAGWSIAGFCPGCALPALGTLDSRVIIFVVALIAGMLATRFVMNWATPRAQPAA